MKRWFAVLVALAAVGLVGAALVGCGSDEGSAVATPPGGGSGASSVSPASPTANETVTPSAPATPLPGYDDAVGGLYQLAQWEVLGDGSGVRLVVEAGEEREEPAIRLEDAPGKLDILLTDVLPLPDTVGRQSGGSGAVASAKLVFPPDDALVILRLKLHDGNAEAKATIARERLSGTVTVVTVRVAPASD